MREDRRRGTEWLMSGTGAGSSVEEVDVAGSLGIVVFSRLRLSCSRIGLVLSVGKT